MRKAMRDIAAGNTPSIDDCPLIANFDTVSHAKEAFDKWAEPDTESALSEKERKNRGCC